VQPEVASLQHTRGDGEEGDVLVREESEGDTAHPEEIQAPSDVSTQRTLIINDTHLAARAIVARERESERDAGSSTANLR